MMHPLIGTGGCLLIATVLFETGHPIGGGLTLLVAAFLVWIWRMK